MDKQEKYTEDILSKYINSGRIEKAPEGFTSKVMSIIETEKIPVRTPEKNRKKTLVPYVFSVFLLTLTIISMFLPGSKSLTLTIPVPEFIKSINLTMPEVDFGNIFNFDLPSIMIYGLIGIILLSLLDKALYRVFHREK
jgi:hypothetical protein